MRHTILFVFPENVKMHFLLLGTGSGWKGFVHVCKHFKDLKNFFFLQRMVGLKRGMSIPQTARALAYRL